MKGETFSGVEVQNVTQIFFDNIGNRYQVVAFTNDFSVDSFGNNIIIQNIFGQPTIYILKFDSNDTYQFHIKINVSPANPIDIKFDSNNNPYLLCQFPQADSLLLYHANGLLFKNVKPNYRRLTGDSRLTLATAICKLNPIGQFQWCNTIFRESLSTDRTTNRNAFLFTSLNNSDILKVCFVNTRLNGNLNDTIGMQNSSNVKSLFVIGTRHLFINYDLNGNLISHSEPFKGRLQFDQKDSINFFYRYLKEVKLLTEGENSYAYLNLFVSKTDSINTVSKVPLSYGNNYLLLKMNRFDSIIWVKPLYVEKLNKFYSAYLMIDFDVDIERQKLIFLLNFSFNEYNAILKPSLNSLNTSGSYLFQFNFNGQVIKEDSFGLATNFYSLAVNPYNKNYCLIGQLNASNARFSGFFPSKLSNKIFLGLVSIDDSGKVDAPIIPIISNETQLSTSININSVNASNEMVGSSGRVYINGYFRDSIQLACNRLNSIGSDTNQFGTNYGDGFVIYHRFSKLININDCNSFLSPSKKFTWNVSGFYSDTIISSLGCDSILSINLNLRGNYLELDTQVLTSYISPSGRFNLNVSGVYYDTLINSNGCDSVYRIKLKVLNSSSIIDTFNCFPIKLLSKNQWLMSSGKYLDTLTNTIGGDSLLTIHFTLGKYEVKIDSANCMDIVSPSGKFLLTQSGTYFDTLNSINNCDSIFIINFKKLNPLLQFELSSCDSFLLPWSRKYISQTGQYSDTLKRTIGCDSIILINYTSLITSSTFKIHICDSVISPSGKYYISNSGIYYDTLVNNTGCDSIMQIYVMKSVGNFEIIKSNDIDCENRFSSLLVSGNDISSVLWLPDNQINNLTSLNPKVYPNVSTTYYATYTDTFGCKFMDSVFVEVNLNDSIGLFPNVFTPNGDGVNDCISLRKFLDFEEVEFLVYSRWGNLVYSTTNSSACWSGEDNDRNRLTEGVYFFVLSGKSKCGLEISKYGSISILY